MKKLIKPLLAACLVALLSLISFSSNAWAYNQNQLDILKSGVENWNNWVISRTSKDKIDLTGADLSGLNLTKAYFRSSDLSGANLTGTTLHDAYLINVKLNNANLVGSDLTDTILVDTDFTGANLTQANLSGFHETSNLINFENANLSDANLNSNSLVGCNIDADSYKCSSDDDESNFIVNFYHASYNENTQFPPNVNPELVVNQDSE